MRYRAFNNDQNSDITVRLSDREIKGHKIILGSASEFFNAICNDGTTEVINLQEDDPEAAMTVLRYAYGFQYSSSSQNGPKFHIDVFAAARKYGVSELESLALAGVLNCVERIQAEYTISDDITDLFHLFRLLTKHKDQDPQFGIMTADVIKKHLKEFWAIEDFRKMVKEDESQGLLDAIVGEIDHTLIRQPTTSVAEGERDRQLA